MHSQHWIRLHSGQARVDNDRLPGGCYHQSHGKVHCKINQGDRPRLYFGHIAFDITWYKCACCSMNLASTYTKMTLRVCMCMHMRASWYSNIASHTTWMWLLRVLCLCCSVVLFDIEGLICQAINRLQFDPIGCRREQLLVLLCGRRRLRLHELQIV